MAGEDAETGRGITSTEEAKLTPPVSGEDTSREDDTGKKEDDAGEEEAIVDPNLVDWDGPNDSANPRNWSKKRKLLNTTLLSLSVLYSNVATTMFAPGASRLYADFGITNSFIATLCITIPSLGASLGPLLLAPLSEFSGRVPIYRASALLYIGCTIGCARSTNASMFIVFRFLGGACAASFLTCGGGTIADLLPKEERGTATAIFTLGPLIAPVIGPVIGGFVAQAWGWRWTFYLVLIFAFIVTVAAVIFMRETNAAILLAKKCARLQKETGNMDLRPAGTQVSPPTPRQLVERALLRPMRMLLFSPIVFLMGLYMALTFGMTYLLFATFPQVFEATYHWSVGISGLAYIGLGIGCVLGLLLISILSDKLLKKDAGPERRLILMIAVGPCVPVGIFWYGWAADRGVHWIVPILGTVFIGIGVMVITSSAQLYMMDMFGPAGAASALAATSLVRNASGSFFPLAADPLYKKLGLGWGNSVLGFIILAFVPIPILFLKYGKYLRDKFPLKL